MAKVIQLKNNDGEKVYPKSADSIVIFTGTAVAGNTYDFTENVKNFKFVLIRQGGLGSRALCPVQPDFNRIIGVTSYNNASSVEIISPRIEIKDNGNKFEMQLATRTSIGINGITHKVDDVINQIIGIR